MFYFIQDLSDKLQFTYPYFTPISFDKFFETGQFEEKTNSVQWLSEQIEYSKNRKNSCSCLDINDPKMIDTSFESPECKL